MYGWEGCSQGSSLFLSTGCPNVIQLSFLTIKSRFSEEQYLFCGFCNARTKLSCVFVCVYLDWYICVFVYLCIGIFIYLFICLLYLLICLFVYLYIWICIFVCLYLWICAFALEYLYLCLCDCVCRCAHICIFAFETKWSDTKWSFCAAWSLSIKISLSAVSGL